MSRENSPYGLVHRQSDPRARWEHDRPSLAQRIPTKTIFTVLTVLLAIVAIQYLFGDGKGW